MKQEELEYRLKELTCKWRNKYPDNICGTMKLQYDGCSAEEGWAEFVHYVTVWEGNPRGSMHGGMIASVMDSAMGTLGVATIQAHAPTISLSVQYLAPVPLESNLHIRVHADKDRGTVQSLHCECWEETHPEILCATGQGLFFRLNEPLNPDYSFERTGEASCKTTEDNDSK